VLPAANERTLLLELIFVLEAIAAPRLHADRFLPLTPIRLVVSHKLEDVTRTFLDTNWERKLQKGSPYQLIENAEIVSRTLPAMFQTAANLAEAKAAALRQSALNEINHLLDVHRDVLFLPGGAIEEFAGGVGYTGEQAVKFLLIGAAGLLDVRVQQFVTRDEGVHLPGNGGYIFVAE
jgi:hypothetical protein